MPLTLVKTTYNPHNHFILCFVVIFSMIGAIFLGVVLGARSDCTQVKVKAISNYPQYTSVTDYRTKDQSAIINTSHNWLQSQAILTSSVNSKNYKYILEVLPDKKGNSFSKNPRATLEKIREPLSTPIFVHDVVECQFISRGIIEKQSWEPHLQQLALAAMQNANVPLHRTPYFLDIGANIGAYSMVLAAGGHRVLAFEPMQYNTELLAASVGRAHAEDRIRIFKTALANISSTDLCIEPASGGQPKQNHGNGQLVKPDQNGMCIKGQEVVPVRSVNAILDQIPGMSNICVNAIKADTEGFENFALRGASSIMTGPCPPCLVTFEFNRKYAVRAALQQAYTEGANGNDIFKYLVDELGYKCVNTRNRRMGTVSPPFHSCPNSDYACVLSKHPRCSSVFVNS